jgi:phenylacetate-CoA ligase
MWHIIARQFALLSICAYVISGWIGRRRHLNNNVGLEIMLTGRFDSDNWILAHLGPLSASKKCSRIWMVSTNPVPELPKVVAIYPPKWLIKVMGSTHARLWAFLWMAMRKRPDIVGGFHIIVNGIMAAIVGRLAGAQSMYFCVGGPAEVRDGGIHSADSYFTKMETPDIVVEKRLLKIISVFDIIITMGTRAVSFFRDKGIDTNFHVVSGGIDSLRFQPNEETATYDLIWTGRLVEVKRMDIFLQTVKKVVEKVPDVRAVIVGDGPLRDKLHSSSRDLGIDSNVSFVGYQGDTEIWLRKSKIFVLTSDSEGLSLSMMEAMMCGLPAIVSDVGDLGDLVENGVNGYLVPPRSPEQFATRIIKLLTDDRKLNKLSCAAHRSALKYETQATIQHWDNIFTRYEKSEKQIPLKTRRVNEFIGIANRKRSQMKKAISKKNIWDKTPQLFKAMLGIVFRIFHPKWLLGKSFRKNCKFVNHTQYWSDELLTMYQLNKLREILQLAFEKSTFYRCLFDSVGFRPEHLKTLDNINQLPTTDKQVVIENMPEMCTKDIRAIDVDYGSTGGTSGTPIGFYMNADRSPTEYGYLVASWERIGYKLGMPMAVFRGRTVPSDRNGLHHEYDPILRHHYYSSFHMTDENMARYLEHITTIGPCILHVYPSSVAALARFILRKGTNTPKNIRGIIAESEIVYPEQRQMVEDVFDCRYFSCYGHSEKLVLASGCEESYDYHVWPTYGYFELLDNDGNPVITPGQRGEIVGTGFINTVMPFIRYRTGDWATYVGDHCDACGRRHTIIRDIQGHRIQEVLITADCSEISWTALNMHDDTYLNVRQFQFRQEKPGQAVLRIVPSDGFCKDDADRIQRNLGRKLDNQLSFTIELVEAIPLSARGKAIYVDQQIQQEKRDSLKSEGNI